MTEAARAGLGIQSCTSSKVEHGYCPGEVECCILALTLRAVELNAGRSDVIITTVIGMAEFEVIKIVYMRLLLHISVKGYERVFEAYKDTQMKH